MKDFFNFLSEARVFKAAEKAKKLGLTSDGSGGWVDRQGNVQARTVGGELVFTQKKGSTAERETTGRVAAGQEDPRARTQQQTEPEVEKGGDEETDGDMKNGETITLVFGRFNPPTVGHEKLLDAAKTVAGSGELRIYPSRSSDPKKNPLEPDEKTNMMKKMFPDHAENIVNDENVKTIFDALKLASEEGYSNVNIVVGSDRVAEFDSLAQKYNGKLYNFDEIETISAGERDAEGEGVEGMSASKMRKAATENDFEAFRQGIPSSLDGKTAKQLMNTVRKRMKVTTESWSLWEIAPKFDWRNLRENYVTGKIFNISSLVENLNTGLVGKVIRRGTNYLICVTEDDIMFKSWVRDLKEYQEKDVPSKMRAPGKPNTLVGTSGYFKHVADVTPGFEKGDKTNLQPGGKPYKGYDIKAFINKNKKK
jgi:nicotinamide mononucleotide adenylyltransferase